MRITSEQIERKILQTLSKHNDGMTISELSRKLGMSFGSVSRAVAVLEAKGKVSYRTIGMAKLVKVRRG